MYSVDVNCDMGEGCPNDRALMDYVSSVNVACGYHAGDLETMRRTVDNALQKGKAIGAHPGYADRNNFGRTSMSLARSEILDLVGEQIIKLLEVCNAAGAKLSHVKPHGALYNQAARNSEIAAAIAEAVSNLDPSLVLFGLSGSESLYAGCQAGLQTASEVFADRTYCPDGSLTPRSEPGALIKDVAAATDQAVRMVTRGTVIATNGEALTIKADTICIHGDGENALKFAEAIYTKLSGSGITIRPVAHI